MKLKQQMIVLILVMLLMNSVPGLTSQVLCEGASEYDIETSEIDDVIDEQLKNALTQKSEDENVEIVIRLLPKNYDNVVLEEMHWSEVITGLKEHADREQSGIIELIEENHGRVLNTFWIANAVLAEVRVGSLNDIARVNNVWKIHENFEVSITEMPPTPEFQDPEEFHNYDGFQSPDEDMWSDSYTLRDDMTRGTGLTWGLERINVTGLWDMGIDGTGIRVAVSDTGVDITHPDLSGKMVNVENDEYHTGGWIQFDDYGRIVPDSTPHDTHGHGTHCSGTIVGGNHSGTQIGVAPGAKLMHALVLSAEGGGAFAQVLAGLEWKVEPFDRHGNILEPVEEHRAHVASMSWGSSGYSAYMEAPIRNLKYAGVVPVAAMGNSGKGSIGSPGAIYEAFGIGASDPDDNIAEWSSGRIVEDGRDDTPEQYVKPDFSAPGVDVLSARPHFGWRYASGTSMATPHVAGTIALLIDGFVSVDQIYDALADTADYYEAGDDLGETQNTRYGHGIINAGKAFEAISTIRVMDPIGINQTHATLRAKLFNMPDDEVEVFFLYREVESSDWMQTNPLTIDEPQLIVTEIEDLVKGTSYEYKAAMEWNGQQRYTFSREFSTHRDVEIFTRCPDLPLESTILRGEVTHMYVDEVEIFFEYRRHGDNYWEKVAVGYITDPLEFSYELVDLHPYNIYECRAVGEINGEIFTGDILLFTAGSSPPYWCEVEGSYLITNVAELQWIRTNMVGIYTIVNDIDASISEKFFGGKGFEPIGNGPLRNTFEHFHGRLDGRNHTIAGLHINRPSEDYIGLFGFVGEFGVVSNVGLVDTNVIGLEYVGSLVGRNGYGNITNSYSMGGEVVGERNVGGLVGDSLLFGNISNSFYNLDSVLINGDHRVTRGAVYHDMFQDWLNNDLMLNISDYSDTLVPVDDHYEIDNVHGLWDLLGFSDRSGYRFRLISDIDLSDHPGLYIPFLTAEFDGNGHIISNLHLDQPNVVGMFGHHDLNAIRNLGLVDVNISGYLVGGLVGYGWGVVENCYVYGTVNGNLYAGGLVGLMTYGTVSNSYANCKVNASVSGGLVGTLREGTIEYSNSSSVVSGSVFVGGLVGTLAGNVFHSHASGNVNGTYYVGGLVGMNWGTVEKSFATGYVNGMVCVGGLTGANTDGTILYSYASGNVLGDEWVGGLVGSMGINRGKVYHSFATGDVTGKTFVGGLVGDMYSAHNVYVAVYGSYSSGRVIADTHLTVGGLIGNRGGFGVPMVEDSFWDVETSGQYSSKGGLGLITSDMIDLSTYLNADWNITSVADSDERNTDHIWNIVDQKTYPFFSWDDSVFIPYHELIINVEGEGSTEPEPGEHHFVYNTEVTISATPATGWRFSHWSGEVPSGETYNKDISIVMDEYKIITAHFVRQEYTLDLSSEGEGIIDPPTDVYVFEFEDEVNITAVPDEGWRFSHWSGDVPEGQEHNDTITVLMDGNKSITANFVRLEFTLNISVEGDGTTDPAPDNHTYEYEDEVTVNAIPSYGWRFSHWTGDVESTNETITIFMDGHKSIVAHFERQEFSLNISVEGDGTTSPSVGVHPYLYEYGATVTAMPATGWRFSHWSGDIDSTDETVTIFMDGNKSIIAHFEELLFIPDDLELIVTPVEGDSPLNVTITVRGDSVGLLNGSVDVLINEAVVHTLIIPAQERAEHTFNHTFQEPGNYTVSFHNLTDTVVVTEPVEVKPTDNDSNRWMLSVAGIPTVVAIAAVLFFMKKRGWSGSEPMEDEDESVDDGGHEEEDTIDITEEEVPEDEP